MDNSLKTKEKPLEEGGALESFEKAGPGHGFRSRQDPEQAGVLAEGREGRCGHTRIVEVRSLVEQRAS